MLEKAKWTALILIALFLPHKLRSRLLLVINDALFSLDSFSLVPTRGDEETPSSLAHPPLPTPTMVVVFVLRFPIR